MRKILPLLVLTVLATAGCAARSADGPSTSGRNVISSEQLRSLEGRYWTAYTVIERLKGNWLRPRTTSVNGQRPLPNVFVDGLYHGRVGSLRYIDITEIERMRYLSAPETTTRFGGSYPGAGAILIETRGRMHDL